MVETYKLDKQKFKEYLKSNKRKFFYRRNPCGCPLAHFLWDEHKDFPYLRVHVGSKSGHVKHGRNVIPVMMPEWAVRFVDQTDSLEHITNVVSSAEALNTLERLDIP